MSSRGRKDGGDTSPLAIGSSSELSSELAKIDTNVLGRIKIFLASEFINGEQFCAPLKQIKDVLERVVVSEMDLTNVSTTTHIRNIYNIITEKLITYLPKIKQSQKAMAFLLTDILSLLVALKIDNSCLTFPAVFASCLLYFEPESEWGDAYNEVVARLCHFVLPNCLVRSEYRQCMCLTSVLMMVLEACSSHKHHLLLTDTLMTLKRDVAMDVLNVITYGTPTVRSKALDLLLHYWPIPIPEFRRHSHKLTYGEWTMPHCENSTCRHSNNIATTLCLSVKCAAQHKAPDTMKLYLLLCPDCDNTIHSDEDTHQRLKLPMPLSEIKPNCEFQRICSGKDKVNKAVVTCYDDSCTAIQNGQPIRMCFSCHSKQHKELNDPTHIYQVDLPDPWAYDNLSSSSTMLEAVAKLIDVVPMVTEAPHNRLPKISAPLIQRNKQSQINMDISKKAIWLLSHYCTPTIEVRANQQEWLIHLLALVLEWMQTYYDILQAAIVKMEEQMTSAGAASVAAGAEGQEWVDSSDYVKEFQKIFSNYSEVTALMESHVLYWIRSVCDTNSECMVEVLKPDISGCAQVGKMWNKAHDPIARYKRTLTIIYRLDYFHRQGKLDSFSDIFNTVMPLWMNKLVDLRADPGKMEGLQDQFRLIFSTQNKKHEQGLRIFKFIREKFWSEDSDERQRGLFWLQDLTRLHIPLPYLPHMFDDALKESHGRFRRMPLTRGDSPMSSFDVEVEVIRKESVGSVSGSDVEPQLLSQSSIEQMDTPIIVNLKSSLTRYILMLDIWLSQLTQLPENVPTLELNLFQNNLMNMLRKVWGSSHDHREPNSICYLCQGVGVWFGLATKILEEYRQVYREGSAGDDVEDIGSSYHRMSTRSYRQRQLVSTPREASATPQSTPPREEDTTSKRFGIQGGLKAFHAGPDITESPYQGSPLGHRRKIAQVQSHSQFRVVSESKFLPAQQSQGAEPTTPSTYIIFQLCVLKLGQSNLQPSALLKIVNCLLMLVQDWNVLDECDDVDTVYTDITTLLGILWKNLHTTPSNTARACVELLLECAKYTADMQPTTTIRNKPSSKGASGISMNLSDTESESETSEDGGHEVTIEEQLLWSTLHNALTSNHWASRFKAAGALTTVIQFMRKPGSTETDVLNLHSKVQASLAHGFCLLVQLLVDKNSSVCARAKYLIASINEPSLDAMKFYLKNFFYEYPFYREEVLSTLSLLDSALPALNFLSVDILTNLLRIATSHRDSSAKASDTDPTLQLGIKKKASDVSVFGGGALSPKLSTQSEPRLEEDPVKQKITERILSLLLRHIANPRIDISESMKKSQGQKTKKAGTIKARRSTPSSSEDQLFHMIQGTVFRDLHCLPQELRKNPVFEVFLNNMFPVLDHNIEFGHTKGLLPFTLKLLCFCAAPNQSDYVQLKLDERLREPHLPLNGCPYSLSSVPSHLQAPWMRIFFVILYKYIHDYSEVDPGSHYQGLEMLTLTQWCLQITLNTLESDGHECSFLSNSEKSKQPSLQRQFTIDAFTHSVMESITGNVSPTKDTGSSTPEIVKSNFKQLLTPVPEEAKSSKDEGDDLVPGICVACKKPTNEYSEEVIALATVAVGTCCHRLPHIVSGFLVSKIIPAVARVVVPGSFSWQSTKNTAEPPPGSAMAVAKHILSSILTQFGDRRLFLFLFGTDYGDKTRTVFNALGHGLLGNEGEGPVEGTDVDSEGEISETTIVKYFLEDAVSSIKDVHPHSIVNVATYIEILDQIQEGLSSTIQLTKDLLLWDNLFKKLKGNTDVLRDKKAMHALLRLIIKLFKNSLEYPTAPMLGNYHTHSVLALTQSLMSIVEFALYNVYVPLGGLVELASTWYRLFQQQSQREAEKLMKLYVSELRKALRARGTADQCPRQDNFLGLIQVLLLEESGYLGYVDSLTTKKDFAPILRLTCEIHSRPVITALQWDFLDVLSYLSATDVSKNTKSIQLVAQLKLSLSQLVALRVQHGLGRSPPTHNLKRLVSGDPRALLPALTTFRSTVIHVLQPRWQDYIQSVHILSWLLLGAMSHNYIDGIAAEMKMAGNVGGQCLLLESLNHKLDEVTKGVLTLASGVIQKITTTQNDGYFGYLCLVFLFSATWTVYMEMYARDSMVLILEFWQKLIGQLAQLMSGEMSEMYQADILEILNKYAVIKIKEINLSCYPLLVPIWREVTNSITDTSIVFPNVEEVRSISMDVWLRDTINELVILEQEWQTDL